ncbi:MAG: cytochrome b N-terminal domain-containing protein [Gemmatimonadaceae bacterium]
MSRLGRWIDERIDLTGIRRSLLDRPVSHDLTWWHTLGSATLAVFLVQVVTGIVLGMYYSPSPDHAYESIRYLERAVVSGATVRGMHHWGASAMVVLVVAHMIRVFTMGAYKYPREINWLLGVALLFIVLGFGFTGYLLPWDQKAYWATAVGTNIAGTTPFIGAKLVALLRGGSQQGAATLTRFYSLHVLLLPVLLVIIVGLHLFLVIRQGVAPRTAELETDAPKRTSDSGYPAYYRTREHESKTGGYRFWPDIIAKDVITGTLVIAILAILGRFVGAPLEAPADPTDSSYVPLPEWYFRPFFQLLKLVPGSWEAAIAVGVPMALVVVLLLLPFFDRRSTRSITKRPAAATILGGLIISMAVLLGASMRDQPKNVVAPEVGRVLTSTERAGRTQFERQQCGGCHKVAGMAAVPKKEDAPDAPDLTEVGLKHSTAWLHSYIEDPVRFHPDSKMPAYGPPTLSHQEIEELARYLASLRGRPALNKQPEFRDTFPEPLKAKENK